MTYMLRNVPPDLWAQVTAKAKADGRPMRALVLDLLRAYVQAGAETVVEVRANDHCLHAAE